MSATKVTGNSTVVIDWVPGVLENTKCTQNPKLIQLDPDKTVARVTMATMHEVGHSHGIRHTGDADNLAPEPAANPPLMGCGQAQTTGAILADDAAQAADRFGARATANWGFEPNLAYWTISSSVTSTTTRYEGNRSAYIPNGGVISTRVRIAQPGNYRMVARYQAVATGATGTVTFRAWRGTVNYTTYPFDDDACNEINIFTEQTGSAVTTPVNVSLVPSSTAWTAFSRDLSTISSEGIRVKIEVVNNSGVGIRVDNVALEER